MSILGTTYNVAPMAPDPEHTTVLDCGAISIGVEYRALDPAALNDYYEGDDLDEINEHSPDGGFTDQGLSLHINSTGEDHEFIRFDLFDDEPHYHYVDKAAGTNTIVGFDVAAHGPMLEWALGQVQHRLGDMLAAANADADAIDCARTNGANIRSTLEAQLRTLGLIEDA
jgi:hypothetical protein